MKQLHPDCLVECRTAAALRAASDAGAAILRRRAGDLPHAESERVAGRMAHGSCGRRPAAGDSRRRALAVRVAEPAPTTTATFPALAPAKFKLTAIAGHLEAQPQLSAARAFRLDADRGYPRGDAKYLPINSMVPLGSGLAGPGRAVARQVSASDAGPGVRRAGRGGRADAALRSTSEPAGCAATSGTTMDSPRRRGCDSHAEQRSLRSRAKARPT